jgi:antitoxin component HigA of HigAB toxin-antitoxin module
MTNIHNISTSDEKPFNVFSSEEQASPDYNLFILRSDLQHVISTVMASENITLSALAEKLGKNLSVVSKQLDGNANLTIKTISEIVIALGDQFRISTKKYDQLVDEFRAAPLYSDPVMHSGAIFSYQIDLLATDSCNIFPASASASAASIIQGLRPLSELSLPNMLGSSLYQEKVRT